MSTSELVKKESVNQHPILIAPIENNRFKDISLFEVLKKRRATKFFDTSIEVDEKDIETIIEMASLSPSAFNLQHWKVVRVMSKKCRLDMERIGYFQPQLSQAPVILAIIMDTHSWCHLSEENSFYTDSQIHNIKSIYKNNEKLSRDEALRSSSMFSLAVMFAATSLGYQSCPMTGCDFSEIASMLGLPSHEELCMLISIGVASSDNVYVDQCRKPINTFFSVI